MNIIIYIIFLSFNLHAIGFDGLNIPSTPTQMALSGAGIASGSNILINPASDQNNSSSLGFSTNRWIQEISGNSLYYSTNGYQFIFSSIGTDDIELRDEIPSDEPLSLINSNLLSFKISRSFHIFKDNNIGVGANFNYTHLFTENSFKSTFDFGLQKPFFDNFKLGMLFKNLGANSSIPTNYGVGVSYLIDKLMTEILFDYQYSNQYKDGIHLGIIQRVKMFTFNIGYSKHSNLRSTISSGFKVNLFKNYRFLYSILSLQNSNFGLAHYFGIELSL